MPQNGDQLFDRAAVINYTQPSHFPITFSRYLPIEVLSLGFNNKIRRRKLIGFDDDVRSIAKGVRAKSPGTIFQNLPLRLEGAPSRAISREIILYKHVAAECKRAVVVNGNIMTQITIK